ncbi:transcriptional regulator [Burkholderia cepacia]|uniref:helix-turn-helix transcriptional regulator n=1 Tax=Burkholderia cepacia TaxID=292 RepID=UPI00075FD8E6|nr:hypothetical protein [Burkholderia cepacia]KWO06048.1 transcriptional regulator [Burkholderia cepacia]
MATRDGTNNQQNPTLPQIGLSKWAQIAPFIPMCRESWRKLGLAGKAPQPIRFSPTHSVYSNAEVHRWIADPLNYRQAVVQDAA